MAGHLGHRKVTQKPTPPTHTLQPQPETAPALSQSLGPDNVLLSYQHLGSSGHLEKGLVQDVKQPPGLLGAQARA